jgi:hypothetical protein
MRRPPTQHAPALLAIAALTAALTAQGTPIGFEEQFALSPDRAKAVATLIPGTEEWFYWHCRERLAARDFATVRQVLPTWAQRHGRTPRWLEIEQREVMLSFDADPARTWNFLRQQLGVTFDHQPNIPGRPSELPTSLEPSLIAPATLTARALAQHPDSTSGFTDRALADLAASQLEPNRLAHLLQRLDRPDVDNLPALVHRDLGRRESGGFGSLPIHRLLRLAQLEDLARLEPKLLQDARFVDACLQRLQPDADTEWQLDPTARANQLARLWQFAQRLPPAFNSLRAHVLWHWLQHDLSTGAPDRDRFLAYIRLPHRHETTAPDRLRRTGRNDEVVDVRFQPPTGLGPIADHAGLLQACLEHCFASEDSVEPYAEFLDRNWLQGVLGETKLLLGQGDPQRWYSLLTPARVAELEQRVELRFPPTLRTHYAANDPVELAADVKHVGTLLVKVYAIDAFRYHQQKGKPVDASIELDGLVANHELTLRYDEPPVRRVRRTFDLPMLQRPGTWVVELVGNGISSRAVVHKGSLHAIERASAAGHIVRVYDEAGVHQPTASVWFGGREYPPDARGEIALPFTTEPGEKQLVLRVGDRSSLQPLQHRAETYRLQCGVLVEREALLAGRRARLLLRPQLRLDRRDVPLELLQNRVLTVVATDLDGLSTTQEVRDVALVDEREFVHEIQVPGRLASLQVSLRGTVQDMAGQPVALQSDSTSFRINGVDASAETGSSLLLRTRGGYVVELRGKNGEPRAGRVCTLVMQHRDYTDPIQVALQTDAAGRIALGPLEGIERLQVQPAAGSASDHDLRSTDRASWPAALHGRAGETLRLPWLGAGSTVTRRDASLLGNERDEFARLAVQDGCLELRDLPPGDYELTLHAQHQRIPVRVTRGARDGHVLLGRDRVLAASPVQPLQLRDVAMQGNDLVIQVANASAATRVHVVATRHLPAHDPFQQLPHAFRSVPEALAIDRAESSYHSGRKLGDEYRYVLERRFATKYAGNMLGRPSLLVNPWVLDDASPNEATGLGGGRGSAYGGRGERRAKAGVVREEQDAAGLAGTGVAGAWANLDWLPEAAPLLANLTPDAAGIVRVPLAQLGLGQHLHVLALDGDQAMQRSIVRDEMPLQPRQRTLPQALPATSKLAEGKRIEFLAAGTTADLRGAIGAQVELFDTIGDVFRLFTTLSRDAELAKFAFLADWPSLPDAKKRSLYDQHACHELHVFLQQKDPAFFAAVVRPLLVDKLEPTFVDRWLLGDDLRSFLEPWTFARLNLIERVLLAKRLGGEAAATIGRRLRDGLELRPVDRDLASRLFDQALRSSQLAEQQAQLGFLTQTVALAPSPAAGAPAAPPPPESADASRLEDKPKAEIAERGATGSDEFLLGAKADREELSRRGQVRALYRAVQPTRLVLESDWWHRRRADAIGDVVAPNRFWVDYATAPAGQPFASTALLEASGSCMEMLLALAVLDLPFTAGEHTVTATGDQRSLRAASPLLLVRKEVGPVASATDQPPLLLGQNLFRLDDRVRFENGERRDVFVTDEFLVDVAYGCQLVVTNPTSQPRSVDVLLQIPAGAVPLQKGFWTKGVTLQLQPYATATHEYAFYFPAAGEFAHYPAHASEQGKLAAAAAARTLRVVATASRVDTTSWDHVSQQGSLPEVLAHLERSNVHRLRLGQLAWRMRDRDAFTTVLAALRARHAYDDTLWSYALLHRDRTAAREYLQHAEGFLANCGMVLRSPLLDLDPVQRLQYQHLELDPLVHPRAHRLGGQRVIGNQDLARQYSALLSRLGYHDTLDSADWLAVTYYLLLQDRIEDALAAFARVDAAAVTTKVQYDYLAAYLAFFTGDVQRARTIATARKDHPVPHWQQRFATVLAQLDEAEGKAPAAGTDAAPDAAATAPALELALAGTNLQLGWKNLAQCEVHYHELDVEFAFSAQPFAADDGSTASFVMPNLVETVTLPPGQASHTVPLPERFRQKNVLVEVRGGGLVRSKRYFANALDVRCLETFGQVVVTTPGTTTPLQKAYVKVFAKLADGTVRFHKDGYTDLRGRFDYASLSDDPNAGAVRYAVLVLDPQRGAVIRDVAPPAK